MSYPADPLPSYPSGAQHPLFVYGTLRRAQENYSLLRGYILKEQAACLEGYALYSVGAYPAVIPGNHTVIGELLWLNPPVYTQVLARLDNFERAAPQPGASALQRRLSQVKTASEKQWAWVYQAVNPCLIMAGQPVPHGDWNRHQAERITHARFCRYIEADMQKGIR